MIRCTILLLLILISGKNALAKSSMRRCLLLPVQDNLGGSISYKVFEELELYLKESDWCLYRPNSEVINILTGYKANLSVHLENQEVLKTIAEKTNSGSLIKIEIESKGPILKTNLSVIGENGSDLYFSEKADFQSEKIDSVLNGIKHWLQSYSKTIPYDARITGVLGDQFSLDMGTQFGVANDSNITIIRPIKKKNHPLLKEIVEWETKKIGDATIFHTSKEQSQGKMTEYEGKNRPQIDDWVVIRPAEKKVDLSINQNNEEIDKDDFGKLGVVSISGEYGFADFSMTNSSDAPVSYSSSLMGINFKGEVWATREFWASLNINKKFGSYKIEEGQGKNEKISTSNGYYKLNIGYRYLPMGFFYGPQVNAYIGRTKYNYALDTDMNYNITEADISGFHMGINGSFPFRNLIRPFLEFEFLVLPKYEEAAYVYGDADSTSGFSVQVGSSFILTKKMNLDASLVHISNKVEFSSNNQAAAYKDTSLRVGMTFSF